MIATAVLRTFPSPNLLLVSHSTLLSHTIVLAPINISVEFPNPVQRSIAVWYYYTKHDLWPMRKFEYDMKSQGYGTKIFLFYFLANIYYLFLSFYDAKLKLRTILKLTLICASEKNGRPSLYCKIRFSIFKYLFYSHKRKNLKNMLF